MNAIAVPFRQLVERRLWPLALLLLVALAAIPLMLSKSGGGAAPATPIASTAVTSAKASATQPIVTVGDAGARERTRRVVGSRKDPFRPAVRATAQKSATTSTTVHTAPNAAKPTGGSTAPTNVFTPVVQTVPKKTYELYSLTVRFGETTLDELPVGNLKRLTSLPDAENPVVIYLGLLKDLRTAVFLVDASAKVQGDGRCNPGPPNCQTIQLKPGEVAFFDVAKADSTTVTQYELDYIKVRRKKTTDAKAARASRAGDGGGRKALRARTSRLGSWRYDAKSGTVKRLSAKALKAEAAARASRASS